MKIRTIILLISLVLAIPSFGVNLSKALQKQAKKEAKELTEQGWKTFSNHPALVDQIMSSYQLEMQIDTTTNMCSYIFGTGESMSGPNRAVALDMAYQLASIEITQKYESVLSTNDGVSSEKHYSVYLDDIQEVMMMYKQSKDGYVVYVKLAKKCTYTRK